MEHFRRAGDKPQAHVVERSLRRCLEELAEQSVPEGESIGNFTEAEKFKKSSLLPDDLNERNTAMT